jgi:exopolysaccharide biosynthesis polyprenyl glycosylphosphotransferase
MNQEAREVLFLRTTPSRELCLAEIWSSLDLALCGLSLFAAIAISARRAGTGVTLAPMAAGWQIFGTLLLGVGWHLSFVLTGVKELYRRGDWAVYRVVSAAALASCCTLVWFRSMIPRGPTGWLPLLLASLTFGLLALCGLLAARGVVRVCRWLWHRSAGGVRNFLVVGTNRRAIGVAESLLENRAKRYRLVGFIDAAWHSDGAPEHYREAHLGGFEELKTHLSDLAVDEVIIALPVGSAYPIIREVIEACREQGILVRMEGGSFDPAQEASANPVGTNVLIPILDDRRSEWSHACKRIVDLLLSSVALCMAMPAMAIIAIAIKLTSPGPVLFWQERVGFGKRRFRVYKFRTMVVDAEALMAKIEHLNQQQGPTFKVKHDPRVTRVGAFLRKTSLDELPQLFNVFRGEMSLVGPRPLSVRDYRGFTQDWHRRRFSVKPGITCLWQVNGRNSVGFERWMELDMEYIDRWSLWLDFKIMLQTIPAVLRGSGAM